MEKNLNAVSLDTLCAALAQAMGVEAPAHAAAPNAELAAYVEKAFGGEKADRVLMYNPDAIPQWIYEKYPQLLKEMKGLTDVELPLCSVMPSVTPVCFGTMYTGAQPEVHGIRGYVKPVITIDTLFDALLRAGKKPAIITSEIGCSLAKIFLEREMDYFQCKTVAEANAKAAELILKDEHDFIVVYNDNYDSTMHKVGPEGLEALCELRANVEAYAMLDAMVQEHWSGHNTLMGFAMDHGAHEIDGGSGSHGLDMPEDLNILHFYKAHCKK